MITFCLAPWVVMQMYMYAFYPAIFGVAKSNLFSEIIACTLYHIIV